MLSPLYGQLSPLRVPTAVAVPPRSSDADANTYILAVEAADGQQLEQGVVDAIEDFVLGCKSDGIWSAIKASCILAGARTLDGALVPLVGTAPTSFNFVTADYNRETGLKGDGATKYLNTNRNNNLEPKDSKHLSVYVTEKPTTAGKTYMGGNVNTSGNSFIAGGNTLSNLRTSVNFYSTAVNIGAHTTGFIGTERNNSANYNSRVNGTNYTTTGTSSNPASYITRVFGRHISVDPIAARLSFYSVGESLDLSLLDTRVSTLMTDLATAIP